MPITLRDSLEPLTMRESARYSPGQANFADYMEAQDTNPISRGWVSTSEGLRGSELLAEANAAERAGDMLRAQQLELQAQDHMRRAQTWAPTTQSFTDINGLGAAANWVGGQVGSGARSMVAPLAGGVGGRVLGGIAGGLIAGPAGAAVGANLGGVGGAFLPSADMQYNEAVGQAMMDPEIRAKRTAEEIHRTGQKVGAVGGALDAVVPAGIGKLAAGGIGKRTVGRIMAREAGEEAITEGAQSYVGQTGQNQLAGRELTDYDHLDAFNAAMSGAIGGGTMGGAGAVVGAARDKLAAGGEKVADVARDPVQTVVDAVHRVVKGDPVKRADREIAEFEARQRPLSKMFEDERATANDERIFEAPKADESDAQVSARMREDIDRWADRILTAKPRELGPKESELREAAAQYKSDGDWMKLRSVLRKNKLADERSSMMSSFEPEGAKASEMTTEGQELDALSNAWLKNEGKRYGEYFADGPDEAKGLGAKLFAWIKSDFGKKLTEDGEIFIPRAFIEALGDRAPGVVESAITAARKEGWDIKDAGDAVATIRQYVNSNEGDTSFLSSAIRYSQQENWTPKMIQRFAKELRQKGGRLDKDDYRWFKTQVGDIVGVLEHFQKPSRFYKAEKRMGMKSDSTLTQAARDQDEKAGITENDSEWGSGVTEVEGDGERKIEFIGVDKSGYPFDTSSEEQGRALRAKISTLANDPAVFAKEIGVWQQAKRAAKGNKALLAEYEDAIIREHGNSLSDANFQGDLNPVDLTTSERNSILTQINKRFRTVEVEGVVADKDPHKIPKEEVQSFRVDSVTNNRRSPEKETVANGFIFFERNIGGKISYFPTTTARLLQHIRGNRRLGKEGAANIEREVKVDGKDKGAAGALSHLEQAIADLIASDKTFTGRVGYKTRGDSNKPVMLADNGRFPGALPLGDGASTAADGYIARRRESARYVPMEFEKDDSKKEIATKTAVDFTTVNHFVTADPTTGNKIGSRRQAEAVAQAMRSTYADVVGAKKKNGKWGVSYNTREEKRSTEHLSETDEMSENAANKFERTVREFQEETGVSLEVDIPSGIKRMVPRVLANARVAWKIADANQRNQLRDLIESKKYVSANKLADSIRFSAEPVSEGGATKNSEQTTSDIKPINPEQALADIARMLGKDFDAKVAEKLGGKAGTWKPGIIRMATSAADGTQFHEALHELFNQMRTHGAANVAQLIERVANSPLILRKLEQLLSDHPKAIKQLKSPEEAAAYLFQFWNMGLINVGPETKSLFQTIKDLIVDAAKELHSWVNAAKRDERKAEKARKMDEAEVRRLFEALAGGAAATSDVNVRQALYDGLRKNIEAHTKAVEDLGQRVEGFWQGVGRYVVTSESMLNLYSKHPELKTVADKFHQMAGKSMRNQARDSSLTARGGLIEAKHAEVQRRLNLFERFLVDGKYDEKDMALATKHLEANTKSADKKINDLIDFVHRYYGEMYDYMVQSDVRRLDPHSEERWVPIQKRKDYFTQSWSIEELTKDHDGFVSTLLSKHARELAYMAQQANAEIAAWNKDPKAEITSPTAKALRDKQDAEFQASGKVMAKSQPLPNVTPEMIAEQIYVRLLNSTGMVDIQETNWSLGLTPAAGAVNRRELDWLDKEAFSKYKSKDLVEIVTNYTRTVASRAEYQKRFGYGGEVIGDAMDTAMLREMGGQELVDRAAASLDGEIRRWKKDARAWHKDNPGVPYAEPYPTLRLVGIQQHRAQVGADASNEALIKAEKTLRPAINAVRAMEGTLGNDISPAMRNFSSWVNTYQNVRLLPLALFTNFSDVIGITVQGGTLGDAWNAFTAGMREVRNTWINEKSSDTNTLRAEEWGVSDAGAMLDTLGQNYSSVYMTEKARNINNKFFRIIGMEGWNRGVRITATAVGERIIGDWVKNGVDAQKPGEMARFERLFGEGADPKKIKLDAQGNLDTQDAANRAAIQRFVQDAVMSSNSAVRATWMSDPRMATFAHLKNFAYAFHSVMLKGILDQTMRGNLRPALVAGLGYASISIAAGAVKEMLIPGDEPYWMKGGLDGYLEYGYNMANLGGVPQMYWDGVTDLDPAKLAGPFWDQIQNTLSSPIPGLSINLSPVDGETELLRDRKVAVELAKALPAGNLAGRAMESLVGD